MSDLDNLRDLHYKLGALGLEGTHRRCEDLVGKAQNGPPTGAGDNSIGELTWLRARALRDALRDMTTAIEALNEDFPTAVFKEGDRVHIARKVTDGTNFDIWVAPMDELVGREGTVLHVDDADGTVHVRVDGDANSWWYPTAALELVQQPSTETT